MAEENKTIQTENNPSADNAAPTVNQAKQASAPAPAKPAEPPAPSTPEPKKQPEPKTQEQTVTTEKPAASPAKQAEVKQAVDPEPQLATPKQSEGGLAAPTQSGLATPAQNDPAPAPTPTEPTELPAPTESIQNQNVEIKEPLKAPAQEKIVQAEKKQIEATKELTEKKPTPLKEVDPAKKEATPMPAKPAPSQTLKTPPPAPAPIAKQPKIQKPAEPKQPAHAKQGIKISIANYLKKLSEFRALANAKRQNKMQANMDKIMEYAFKTQKVVNDDVERLTGVKHRQATSYLKRLTNKGLLVKFGSKSNTFYKPTIK